jgi:hypothetical protein
MDKGNDQSANWELCMWMALVDSKLAVRGLAWAFT